MKPITNFLTFKDIVRSFGGQIKNVTSNEIDALIDDIILEVNEFDHVETERIFKNICDMFKLSDIDSKNVVAAFTKYIKQNNITESFSNATSIIEPLKEIPTNDTINLLLDQLRLEYAKIVDESVRTITISFNLI